MRNKNNLYSRNYFNYEQLNEYSDVGEINNKEYKKKLRNVKPRYLEIFKNKNKRSRFMEDKYFNNLMTSYIEDYNKLKNKYHFKDDEDMKNTNIEIDKKDYDLKKQDINKIFSGNILDIKDFNFDICDNLINDMPKDDNITLLKSTQNKEDYEYRLQGIAKNKKNETLKEENEEEDMVNIKGKDSGNLVINGKDKKDIKNNDVKNNKNIINENNMNDNNEDNKAKESEVYIENDAQFKENDNYLKLNQQKLDDDLPLLYDILSSNYNKNYKIPFYEHEKDETLKKSEDNYSDFEKEKILEKADENHIILINENKENMKFEDIISSDFDNDYKIPEYKVINSIQIEKVNKQPDNQKQRVDNEENKIGNKIAVNNNNNLLSDKIRESGALAEVENENNKNDEEKKDVEPKNEKVNIDNNNKDKRDNDENYDFNDENFDKVAVDDLKDIEDFDEEKKYNDFSS